MAISQDKFFEALRILRENNLNYSGVNPDCITFDWEDEAEKATQLLTGFEIKIRTEPPIKQVVSEKKESHGTTVGLRDLLGILRV